MTLDDKKTIQKFRLIKSVANLLFLLVAAIITIGFLYTGHSVLLFIFLSVLAITYIIFGWQYCRLKEIVISHMSSKERSAWIDSRCMRDEYIKHLVTIFLVMSMVGALAFFVVVMSLPLIK